MIETNEKPKKTKKWIIIIFVAIIVISSLVSLYIFRDKLKEMEIFKKEEVELTYEVGQIVVNLRDIKTTRYLKTKIVLGYYDDKKSEVIVQKKHKIKDIIIRTLRSKTKEEISSVESTDALKSDMMNKLNDIFEDKVITSVYITDFMIQ